MDHRLYLRTSATGDPDRLDGPHRPLHPVLNVPLIEFMITPDPEITRASIMEYPNDIPSPTDPMLINHIYKSAAYVEDREADVELSKPTQLAASEVDCMARHLREFEEAHPDNNKKYFLFTQGDLQYFLQAIFLNWNSSMSFGPEPVLRKRRLSECSVVAGTFTEDLPTLSGQEGPMVGHRSSDVAYLAITIRDLPVGGALITHWKDMLGNDVEDSKLYPRAVLNLAPPVAVARAVRRYDKCELARVMGYNFDLAVWWARRQIVMFSKKGVKKGAAPARPEFQPPEKPVFAEAHIKEMINFWSAVLDS